jgi:hypothetical protein
MGRGVRWVVVAGSLVVAAGSAALSKAEAAALKANNCNVCNK